MRIFFICLIISLPFKSLKAEQSFDHVYQAIKYKVVTDTTTYPISTLAGVNWTVYYNRSINNFLYDLDKLFPGYILGKIYPKDRISMAGRINVYYGNGIAFIITVSKFQHMNPSSHDGSWDINLFRQENISQIELWDNTICRTGCDE
jgi:hypothetical protein